MSDNSRPKRCCISTTEHRSRCKHEYFTSLKVQVHHSDTGRKTWQTWHLCRGHFDNFLNLKGDGYYAWYRKKPFKKAFVIGFKLIGAI